MKKNKFSAGNVKNAAKKRKNTLEDMYPEDKKRKKKKRRKTTKVKGGEIW